MRRVAEARGSGGAWRGARRRRRARSRAAAQARRAPNQGRGSRAHARPKAAQLGFVKPHLGHLMAVLEIDQGRVGTLAAVGYEAEIETWRATRRNAALSRRAGCGTPAPISTRHKMAKAAHPFFSFLISSSFWFLFFMPREERDTDAAAATCRAATSRATAANSAAAVTATRGSKGPGCPITWESPSTRARPSARVPTQAADFWVPAHVVSRRHPRAQLGRGRLGRRGAPARTEFTKSATRRGVRSLGARRALSTAP